MSATLRDRALWIIIAAATLALLARCPATHGQTPGSPGSVLDERLNAMSGQIEAVQADVASEHVGLAQQDAELQRLIDALTARIEVLEARVAELSNQPTPVPPPAPGSDEVERVDITGAEVVQRMRAGERVFENLRITGGVSIGPGSGIDNVTFRGCDFRAAAVLLTVYDSVGWTFEDCTFEGATRPPGNWGHSHGAFFSGIDAFTFRRCAFRDNGWLAPAPGSWVRFNQNHNVYFDRNVGSITFRHCTFERAAAQGIKARGVRSLTIRDCIFRGNLIDVGLDGRSPMGGVLIEASEFSETGGEDSGGLPVAWSIAADAFNQGNRLDSLTVRDCRWTGPAGGFPDNQAYGVILRGDIADATFDRLDFRDWRGVNIRNQIGARLTLDGAAMQSGDWR